MVREILEIIELIGWCKCDNQIIEWGFVLDIWIGAFFGVVAAAALFEGVRDRL